MSKTQFATRVDDEQASIFKKLTAKLGTTPADALRMFVSAFNEAGGFPYDVRVKQRQVIEAFDNEDDAMRFANDLALKASR